MNFNMRASVNCYAPSADPAQLADYLRAEQRLGRVRPDLDPAQTAVVLLATLFALQTNPITPATGLARQQMGGIINI